MAVAAEAAHRDAAGTVERAAIDARYACGQSGGGVVETNYAAAIMAAPQDD